MHDPVWLPPRQDAFELTIYRAVPSKIVNLESLRIGDVDGDGRVEVVTGGDGALICYRPDTAEHGVIGEGHFGVCVALEDIDGDGVLEVVAGRERDERNGVWMIAAYKRDADGAWRESVLVPEADSEPHDVAFADLDGDGVRELVADAPYCQRPGTVAYTRAADPASPWDRHELVMGAASEGVLAADLNSDGRLEIIHGPDWYEQPEAGTYSGEWRAHRFAENFRDGVRVALVDMVGDGVPDIVCSEAEYPDGRLSWFENPFRNGGSAAWREHPLDWGLYYAHSLWAARQADGVVRVVLGEMHEGGYKPPRNWQARLVEYLVDGQSVRRRMLSQAAGTHEAVSFDLDGDGEHELVGKDWREPAIQIWKRRAGPAWLSRFSHLIVDRDKPDAAPAICAFDVDRDGRIDLVCGSRWYANPDWQRHELPNGVIAHGTLGDDALVVALPTGELALLRSGDSEFEVEVVDKVDLAYAASVRRAASNELFVVTSQGAAHHYVRGANGWSRSELGPADPSAAVGVVYVDAEPLVFAGSSWFRGSDEGFRVWAPDWDLPLEPLAVAAGDVDGDGSAELVVGTEGPPDLIHGDHDDLYRQLGRLYVLRRFDGPPEWRAQPIDSLRRPRSLTVADLDGDGVDEIVCGEHDPSWPYRTQSRLYVYARGDSSGRTWRRHTLEDRFEHDHGPCVFESAPGRFAIASHGTSDRRFVHLWEPVD